MRLPKLVLIFLISMQHGCAHRLIISGYEPKILLDAACGADSPGASLKAVKGSVWLKAKSNEASGQFPASVMVTSPAIMRMEIQNLFGGVEAIISVEGNKYKIEVPNDTGKAHLKETGKDHWGGIPLNLAVDLFLGKLPCPTMSSVRHADIEDDQLVITSNLEERFVYRFEKFMDGFWPDYLHWERYGERPLSVEFRFYDPENGTKSPKRWEAKSKLGEIKVRWREREMLR
ncbi:MAG: hypothetical protein AABZ06_11605 [Bdellovibrionota bacterium]